MSKLALQREAAALALAAKRGERSPLQLRGAAKEMYESMSIKELERLAPRKRPRLAGKKKSR